MDNTVHNPILRHFKFIAMDFLPIFELSILKTHRPSDRRSSEDERIDTQSMLGLVVVDKRFPCLGKVGAE